MFCFVLLCPVQVASISYTDDAAFAKPCQVKVALGQEMTRGWAFAIKTEIKHATDVGYVVIKHYKLLNYLQKSF